MCITRFANLYYSKCACVCACVCFHNPFFSFFLAELSSQITNKKSFFNQRALSLFEKKLFSDLYIYYKFIKDKQHIKVMPCSQVTAVSIATLAAISCAQPTADVFEKRPHRVMYPAPSQTQFRAYAASNVPTQSLAAKQQFCKSKTYVSTFSSPGFLPVVRTQADMNSVTAAKTRDLPNQGAFSFLLNMQLIQPSATNTRRLQWLKTTAETGPLNWGTGNCENNAGNINPDILINCANSIEQRPYFVAQPSSNNDATWRNQFLDLAKNCMRVASDGSTSQVSCTNTQDPALEIIVCQFEVASFTPYEACDSGKTFIALSASATSFTAGTFAEAQEYCARMQFRGRQGAMARLDSTNNDVTTELYNNPTDIAWRSMASNQVSNANDRNFWVSNRPDGNSFEGLCMSVQMQGSNVNFAPSSPLVDVVPCTTNEVIMCEFCNVEKNEVFRKLQTSFVQSSGNRANDASLTCASQAVDSRVGSVTSVPTSSVSETQSFISAITAEANAKNYATSGKKFLVDAYWDGSQWKWFRDGSTVASNAAISFPNPNLGGIQYCLTMEHITGSSAWRFVPQAECNTESGSQNLADAVFCQYESSVAPTPDPTVEPTAEPTETPTESPTEEPTPEPTMALVYPPAGKVASFVDGKFLPNTNISNFRGDVAATVGAPLSQTFVSLFTDSTRQTAAQTACVYFEGTGKETYAARFRREVSTQAGRTALGLTSIDTIETDGSNTAQLCRRATTTTPVVPASSSSKGRISLGAFLGTIIPLAVGVLAVIGLLAALFCCLKKKSGNGTATQKTASDSTTTHKAQQSRAADSYVQSDTTNQSLQQSMGAGATTTTRVVETHTTHVSSTNTQQQQQQRTTAPVTIVSNGPPTNTKLSAPPGVPPPPADGDWVWDNDSRLYWSDNEYLYFDPETTCSYDPKSGMWYDPATGQWEQRN